jgi:deazaflavin-dependent oxidoreductase (nitroreductase family)
LLKQPGKLIREECRDETHRCQRPAAVPHGAVQDYFNLAADPRARVEVAGRTLRVRAEELSADEAAAFWPRILQTAADYARYPRRTNRRIRLIRLIPEN